MASELNCTQLLNQWPDPETGDAKDLVISQFINTVVLSYRPFHYFILACVVIFAFFANILILIVLSRKEMRYSGVNVTMMLISICDLVCAIAGLIQLYLRNFSVTYTSYIKAYTQLTVDYFQISFHAASLYLALGMAFCRVVAMSSRTDSRYTWQSPKYSLRIALLLCIPVFIFGSHNVLLNHVEIENGTIVLNISPLSLANSCLFLKLAIFLNGLFFKIVPCILMMVLSFVILARMKSGKKASNTNSGNHIDAQIVRSSRFIQAVIVVFVITEAPQGVLSLLGGLSINDYIKCCDTFLR
ncbi:G-protein coupled receptors family 1 profile domain-containing protein [Caenorhabditis elegans]|uniref:G-protein coupled receptors family 1 profile domain-containing protein n=1 Tax=Caenorhabditis elegans TaxID=6239 RepID=Q23292_CAEEL|nr:G-protein coupled receptors family 1 profile domain-containing protein [Caenorhabditis elegans]CCD72496.1 G-protein coupled receptors family 1 profile domain-containing protein [Caenorhabditis elegans]|eukprot:NP_504724.1 DroMyoSuppressin Receptor related [Caenorhabditis elegans]